MESEYDDDSEKEFHDKTRVAMQGAGCRMFRNNNGMAKFEDKGRVRVIKYGLGTGTSDLIGWRTVTITPDMIGQRVAIFVAAEGKRGKARGRLRMEQDSFQRAVRAAGGIAFEYGTPEEAAQKVVDEK